MYVFTLLLWLQERRTSESLQTTMSPRLFNKAPYVFWSIQGQTTFGVEGGRRNLPRILTPAPSAHETSRDPRRLACWGKRCADIPQPGTPKCIPASIYPTLSNRNPTMTAPKKGGRHPKSQNTRTLTATATATATSVAPTLRSNDRLPLAASVFNVIATRVGTSTRRRIDTNTNPNPNNHLPLLSFFSHNPRPNNNQRSRPTQRFPSPSKSTASSAYKLAV